MNGPIIKPSPKAAPTKPKFFALSFGSVTSAIAACAIAIFPPGYSIGMPRATKSSGRLLKLFQLQIQNTQLRFQPLQLQEAFLSPISVRELTKDWRSKKHHEWINSSKQSQIDVTCRYRYVMRKYVIG